MEIARDSFQIESQQRFAIESITAEVQAIVDNHGATTGLVMVTMPHTSAAIATNECEPKLLEDMTDTFTSLVPPNDGYLHDTDHIRAGEAPNAHAHLLAALVDTPVLLVLEAGELQLGTWEEIMCFEFTGPRERTVEVTILE